MKTQITADSVLANLDKFKESNDEPECAMNQYLPIFAYELSKTDGKIPFRNFNNNLQVYITRVNSLTLSRFLIFTVIALEILLNVTFNRSTLNLLRVLFEWWHLGVNKSPCLPAHTKANKKETLNTFDKQVLFK